MVATRPSPPPGPARTWPAPARRGPIAILAAAALLVLLAFLTTSGTLLDPGTTPASLVPTSWTDAVLILAGGGAIAALIVRRFTGGGTLTASLFAATAALSALSIAWSVAPDQSWAESGRTLAYVAVFAIAVITARALHERTGSRGAVLTITLAAQALCLWALAVKALNLNLYSQPLYGPLVAPFGYWNTTGMMGALALPGSIHLAAAARGRRLTRGLGLAGITVAVSVVVLTYSRSAVAAALLGMLVSLCFTGQRRRAVAMAVIGLLGAAPICILGIADHNLAYDLSGSLYGPTNPLIQVDRNGAGAALGVLAAGMIVTLTLAGAALSGHLDDHRPPVRWRRAYDRALIAAVAAVPVLAVAFLLVNSRGPFGEISHLWSKLTSVSGYEAGGGADRLDNLANSRALYWREALQVGRHHLIAGAGAGAFDPAYLHYHEATLSNPGQQVDHAHSYVLETFATLGLAGCALNLALFGSWWRDAISAVRHRDATEADARWALIGVVVAFGVSSAMDKAWYFPGATAPALVAAGWIAGASRRSTPTFQSAGGPARPPAEPRPLAARPGAILALTALALVALGLAWASLAPMRAEQDIAASLAAQERGSGAAVSDARAAVSADPLSAMARERLGAVYGGSRELAQDVKATQIQPDNPQPFAYLGGYLLCDRHQFDAALSPLRHATMLDLTDSYAQSALLAGALAHHTPTACSDL